MPHGVIPAAPSHRRRLRGERTAIELHDSTVSRLSAAYGDSMADGNYSDLIFGREYDTAAPPFAAPRAADRT